MGGSEIGGSRGEGEKVEEEIRVERRMVFFFGRGG